MNYLYVSGHGYHIITPELFAHLNHINGFATLQECVGGGGHPLMSPLQTPPPVAEMTSIACQTEELEETHIDKVNNQGPNNQNYHLNVVEPLSS